MSEKTGTELNGEKPGTKGMDTSNDGARSRDSDAGTPNEHNQRRGPGVTAVMALIVALAAAGVSGWQAYESRQAKDRLELELARKLAEIETVGKDSRQMSAGARDIVRDVEARLGQLEARVVDMQHQRLALESLYQELSQSRDEWTLAEVEQILLVASQQLQLASNVKAALIALETADARLARSDRPQLTEVRRAIVKDIERLKALPFVDVTGIGLKLEQVIERADSMPLAMETRPEAVSTENTAAAAGGWRQAAAEAWQDLLSLIRIERIDSRSAPMLAPDQAFFLRENLKLRLLEARVALLSRDQATFKADLATAIDWLSLYYDVKAENVAASIETLRQLEKSTIRIELPDIGASLDAVRSYRLVKERSVR